MTFIEQAIDHLTQRLEEGRKVDGLTLGDLIESDLAGPRALEAEREVATIFTAPAGERAALIDQHNAKLIAAYLNNRSDFVRETAAELAAEPDDEPRRFNEVDA